MKRKLMFLIVALLLTSACALSSAGSTNSDDVDPSASNVTAPTEAAPEASIVASNPSSAPFKPSSVQADGTLKTALDRIQSAGSIRYVLDYKSSPINTAYHADGVLVGDDPYHYWNQFTLQVESGSNGDGQNGEWLVADRGSGDVVMYFKGAGGNWEPWQMPGDASTTLDPRNVQLGVTELFSLPSMALADASTMVGSEQVDGVDADHYRYESAGGFVFDMWISKTSGDLIKITRLPANQDTNNGSTLIIKAIDQPENITLP